MTTFEDLKQIPVPSGINGSLQRATKSHTDSKYECFTYNVIFMDSWADLYGVPTNVIRENATKFTNKFIEKLGAFWGQKNKQLRRNTCILAGEMLP